jgi:hypothetical protein
LRLGFSLLRGVNNDNDCYKWIVVNKEAKEFLAAPLRFPLKEISERLNIESEAMRRLCRQSQRISLSLSGKRAAEPKDRSIFVIPESSICSQAQVYFRKKVREATSPFDFSLHFSTKKL